MIAARFVGGDGVVLTAQIAVEPRVGREQGALEGRQRVEQMIAFGGEPP